MIYDVIIIGAGPAGGMAAKVLSKNGYNILVIDRKRQVGHPVQCGEFVSGRALKNSFLKANDNWVKKKIKGAKIVVPSGEFFYATKELGYSIDRKIFDPWIVNQAVDNGAKLLLKTKAVGVEKKNCLWVIKTNKAEYVGRILIGADGPASNIARRTGLLKSREYLKGVQYKFRAKDIIFPEEDFLSLYASTRFQGGYAWVFPRGDEYNVGVDGYEHTKQHLKDFCKFLGFDTTKKIEINAGMIPYHYVLNSYSKDGVMIVGDAAGMTNPMSGGGINPAMFSGRIAGEAACKALSQENLSLLSEYDILIKRSPFLDPILFKASEIFRKWDDELYNFLGDMMKGIDQSQLTYFKGFKKIMKKAKYFSLLREFMIMKKAMQINQKYGW